MEHPRPQPARVARSREGKETAPRAHSGGCRSLGAASSRGQAGPSQCPRPPPPSSLQSCLPTPLALGPSRNAKGAEESGSPLRFMGRTRTATFTFVSDMLAAPCSARRGPFKRRAAAAAAAARPQSAAAAAPPRAPRRSAEARGPSRGSATRGTAGPGEGRARGGARRREEAAGPGAALAARAGPCAQHRGPSRPPGAGQRRHLSLRGPRPGLQAAANGNWEPRRGVLQRRSALDSGTRQEAPAKAIGPGLRAPGSWDPRRGALQRRSTPGSRQLGTGKGRFTKTIGPGLGAVGTREGAPCKGDLSLAPGSWAWRREPLLSLLQSLRRPHGHCLELESPSEAAVTLTARALGRYEGLGAGVGCAGLIHTSHTPPPKSTARRPSEPHTEPCTGILRSLW